MNGEAEAGRVCLTAGFSGGSATCLPDTCTWDTKTCTGNVKNVNNLNNNLECDPLGPQAGCGTGAACYFDQNETRSRCEGVGTSPELAGCNHSNDCLPGLVCLYDLCTRMCDQSGSIECRASLPCYVSGWPEDWGFCPLTGYGCDPVSGEGCPDPEHACYVVPDGLTPATTACLHPGTSVGGCSNGSVNECTPRHVCVQESCRPLCDDNTPCSEGTCVMGLLENVGVCQ